MLNITYEPIPDTAGANCPFCDSEQHCFAESLPENSRGEYICWVECLYCVAQGPAAANRENAVAKWIARGDRAAFEAIPQPVPDDFVIEDSEEDKDFHRHLDAALRLRRKGK